VVSLLDTVKNTDRLRQIATVLAKHGFGELLSRTGLPGFGPRAHGDGAPTSGFPVRLRRALQELGPSFVKLGQIVSTRPDLIPADVIVELKKLQDDVPPIPPAEVETALVEAFGDDPPFSHFEREPLASASIGQAHVARLSPEVSGSGVEVDVVVKLQRPGIKRTIERDLDLLHLLARLVERHIPESRVYSPIGLVSEFDRAIMAELDFTIEADNADKFARNFEGDATVRFPHIYRQASTNKVLTMERFFGAKIYDFVDAGGDAETIAKNALNAVARMIFEHGFFHADPHPGNIIMLGPHNDPVIGMIDLGLVGRLSPDLRDKAIALMIAAVKADANSLADALLAMGRPKGRVDMQAFRAEVAVLSEKYLGRPISEIEVAALIRDLVQGAIKYEIDMPVELMMVGKALMTIEGIGKEIYPELDVVEVLRPYLLKLLWQRYSPERLSKDLLRGVTTLSSTAQSLPIQVNDILEDLRSGRLAVSTRDPLLPAATDRLGRRIYASVSLAAFTLGGVALLAAGRQELLGWGLLGAAALQALTHLGGDLMRRSRD